MKFSKYINENNDIYKIVMLKKQKEKALNPKTNRMKNKHHNMYHETTIKPEDRTFKNLPRYADNKPKVDFKAWLLIKPEKANPNHSVPSIGKSEADGKWYSFSHRAIYGFKKGDHIKGDSAGKKVEYPKLPNSRIDFDNGKYEPDFVIKDDEHAKQVAITFADSVS